MTTSVVIPTMGRTEAARAIQSAYCQEGVSEILLVVASPEADINSILSSLSRAAKTKLQVVRSESPLNGSAARNLGTDIAQSDYVAYLDDDDWWHPEKIAAQVAWAEQHGAELVTCAAWIFDAKSGSLRGSSPVPRREPQPPFADYVLQRPRPRYGHHLIQTSTFLASAELARRVRWNDELSRHQDWDFFLRALRRGTRLAHVDRGLTFVARGSSSSVSRSTDWQTSLRWLKQLEQEESVSARSVNDFLATIVVGPALANRDSDTLRLTYRQFQRGGLSIGAITALARGLASGAARQKR